MRSFRIIVVLLIFCAAGVAVAGVRVEQARCMARIQQLRWKQIELKQTLHQQQLQLARLRSPEQVQERIERLAIPVISPLQRLQEAETLLAELKKKKQ